MTMLMEGARKRERERERESTLVAIRGREDRDRNLVCHQWLLPKEAPHRMIMSLMSCPPQHTSITY